MAACHISCVDAMPCSMPGEKPGGREGGQCRQKLCLDDADIMCWVQGDEQKEDEFAIVFAAMGVNMETAHFFKQVSQPLLPLL